jgi:hypothetical protein
MELRRNTCQHRIIVKRRCTSAWISRLRVRLSLGALAVEAVQERGHQIEGAEDVYAQIAQQTAIKPGCDERNVVLDGVAPGEGDGRLGQPARHRKVAVDAHGLHEGVPAM